MFGIDKLVELAEESTEAVTKAAEKGMKVVDMAVMGVVNEGNPTHYFQSFSTVREYGNLYKRGNDE